MKRILSLALVLCLTLPLFAQEVNESEKNVLKVNTLSLIVGTGSIFYERHITDNTAGQMGVAFLNYKFEEVGFSGLILTPEFKYYPKGNACNGFYLAPYLRYQNFSAKSGEDKGTYTNFGGGLAFGRQWIMGSGFTMDLFFGAHYGNGNFKIESGTEEIGTAMFDGIKTRMGFALGFAF